jgi:hypothetical protein
MQNGTNVLMLFLKLESEKQKDDKIAVLEKRINDLQDLAVYKTKQV